MIWDLILIGALLYLAVAIRGQIRHQKQMELGIIYESSKPQSSPAASRLRNPPDVHWLDHCSGKISESVHRRLSGHFQADFLLQLGLGWLIGGFDQFDGAGFRSSVSHNHGFSSPQTSRIHGNLSMVSISSNFFVIWCVMGGRHRIHLTKSL